MGIEISLQVVQFDGTTVQIIPALNLNTALRLSKQQKTLKPLKSHYLEYKSIKLLIHTHTHTQNPS